MIGITPNDRDHSVLERSRKAKYFTEFSNWMLLIGSNDYACKRLEHSLIFSRCHEDETSRKMTFWEGLFLIQVQLWLSARFEKSKINALKTSTLKLDDVGWLLIEKQQSNLMKKELANRFERKYLGQAKLCKGLRISQIRSLRKPCSHGVCMLPLLLAILK